MAISEKQRMANRENAKKGGIKTEEGKLRSRLNSVKHGMLLTSQMLLPGEDVKKLTEFQRKVIFELVPSGELELLLVDRLITCAWRLRRVISVEKDSILGLYKKRDVKSPELLAYDKRIAELRYMHGITDSPFHLLRILNYLNIRINTSSRIARGYVDIYSLILAAEEVSIRREIIIDSLNRLAHFNLVEFDNQSRDNIETASHVKITFSGIHYLQTLLFEFTYLDSVLVDTPISSDSTYNYLKYHIDDNELNQRLERTEAFVNYLFQCENREFSDHPEYLAYELTSEKFGLALHERFPRIKDEVLSITNIAH